MLDSLHVWLELTLARLSRKSDTAAAIRYALSRWAALTRYVEDGHLEIDNNAAERALRCVAMGRKNFLFAGSDFGGDAQPLFTHCSALPSSTGSIRSSISATSSRESLTIPSAGSRNCYLESFTHTPLGPF